MSDEITGWPLCWPFGRPRTKFPEPSRFKLSNKSMSFIRNELIAEIGRMKGKHPIISSNLVRGAKNIPVSGQRQPNDRGVAAYFKDRNGRDICIACDRWKTVEENMYAIMMTIDAIRSIQRWGSQEAVDAAFAGFQQLPPPSDWMPIDVALRFLAHHGKVTEIDIQASRSYYLSAYREAAAFLHPDRGGTDADFSKLQKARDVITREASSQGWWK